MAQYKNPVGSWSLKTPEVRDLHIQSCNVPRGTGFFSRVFFRNTCGKGLKYRGSEYAGLQYTSSQYTGLKIQALIYRFAIHRFAKYRL